MFACVLSARQLLALRVRLLFADIAEAGGARTWPS
jgi:hypothetical protein